MHKTILQYGSQEFTLMQLIMAINSTDAILLAPQTSVISDEGEQMSMHTLILKENDIQVEPFKPREDEWIIVEFV